MMPSWLLDLIRCPITLEKLEIAAPELVVRLRAEISAGKLLNRLGATVSEDFQTGLLNASGTWLYAVVDDIPVLLPDEAIAVRESH